jgi:N-succinyldiaminopimelate aminotransferase
MNPGFEALQPYPFQRLAQLFDGVEPGCQPRITLTVGEPGHLAPSFVLEALAQALDKAGCYPSTAGSDDLRSAIADWLATRFGLAPLDPNRQVLPVNGTREALFAIAQVLVTPGTDGAVVCPNPFYQIYEGAALLAGSTPTFAPVLADTCFQPDFSQLSDRDWAKVELLYLCNPGNPAGAVMPQQQLQNLIRLAREHNFVIASDECYSEIYPDEDNPPGSLLTAAAAMGHLDYRNCLVFHSLSKRSNLPGLRSGFVAGDADLIARFLHYRTYHGCAMPPHHQAASAVAWRDEHHVHSNRALYRSKFSKVLPLLSPVLATDRPEAGFYLWPETPVDDTEFATQLLARCNVAVLPGQYLGRPVAGMNPGAGRVRIALVAEEAICVEAAERIVHSLQQGW